MLKAERVAYIQRRLDELYPETPVPLDHGDPFTLLDRETNSSWDALSGLATAGPLAGEQLERIKSTTIFWFGWTDFHPDTKLYGIIRPCGQPRLHGEVVR